MKGTLYGVLDYLKDRKETLTNIDVSEFSEVSNYLEGRIEENQHMIATIEKVIKNIFQ